MPIPNIKPSKVYGLQASAASVAPQSMAAAATAQGGWVAVAQNKWAKVIASLGAGTGTLAVKLEQATDSSGTGVKDLATAASLSASALANTTETALDIDLPDTIDLVNSFAFIRLNVTMTGGSGTLAGVTLELGPQIFES